MNTQTVPPQGEVLHSDLLHPDLLHGARIIDAVKKAGVEYVLSVPDLHTSKGLLYPIAGDHELKLVRVCKEDECIGISAGLTYGNKRSLVLLQYTGFLYAINAIRAIACEYKFPTVMMIGMLGLEEGVAPKESRKFGLKIIAPILETMEIPYEVIDTDDDIHKIAPAIEHAYAHSHPTAFLIARRPVAP
jgi:sulfopyruvate decarboxylase subunit alpha